MRRGSFTPEEDGYIVRRVYEWHLQDKGLGEKWQSTLLCAEVAVLT